MVSNDENRFFSEKTDIEKRICWNCYWHENGRCCYAESDKFMKLTANHNECEKWEKDHEIK